MSIFGKSKTELREEIVELKSKLDSYKNTDNIISELKAKHERDITKVKFDHDLEKKTIEFTMKNFKDEEILTKNKEIEKLTNSNAVLTKENEMMNKMVDINADIVDVKDIINKLINKLPEVNLSSINVTTAAK